MVIRDQPHRLGFLIIEIAINETIYPILHHQGIELNITTINDAAAAELSTQ